MALRIALGAQRRDVVQLIVRRGMLVVSGGAVLGLIAVVAATRYLEAVLVGIHTTDPLILGGILLLLAAWPWRRTPAAYRATRENPRTALQEE